MLTSGLFLAYSSIALAVWLCLILGPFPSRSAHMQIQDLEEEERERLGKVKEEKLEELQEKFDAELQETEEEMSKKHAYLMEQKRQEVSEQQEKVHFVHQAYRVSFRAMLSLSCFYVCGLTFCEANSVYLCLLGSRHEDFVSCGHFVLFAGLSEMTATW